MPNPNLAARQGRGWGVVEVLLVAAGPVAGVIAEPDAAHKRGAGGQVVGVPHVSAGRGRASPVVGLTSEPDAAH